MFSLERWQEILETISKNKLRTFLTGLSVASGIFILVILLGFGQGMQNGISAEFQRDAANRISVYSGVTSMGYKGLNPGRFIEMTNDDYNYLVSKYEDDIEFKSSIYRVWSGTLNYGDESGSYRVEGVYPDYQFLENEDLVAGRYINYDDQKLKSKIMIIGNKVKQDLFGSKEAVGEYVQINGINFKVVGVYSDPGGEREETRVFVPLSTSQR
ncbi:MAG TPA: ABC transporter ATP-binding protein, partial [Leeuwenhoekiella sp.]|nr:ABC transporter ATP-binding protein [Leeuwenhoekiella sp.]